MRLPGIWDAGGKTQGKRALRHGNVHNSLFRHGKRHEQGSYTHSHNAGRRLKLPLSLIPFYKNGGNHHQERKYRVHGSCAHQRAHHIFTTEYRHAAAPTQRGDSRQRQGGFFHTQKPTNHFFKPQEAAESEGYMAFFNSAVTVLQTLVIALGAGLGVWGVINLLEGYGNDNPGANAHVR